LLHNIFIVIIKNNGHDSYL